MSRLVRLSWVFAVAISAFAFAFAFAYASPTLARAQARAPRARRAPRRVVPPPPVPALTLIVEPEAERPFHVRVRLDVAREGVLEAVADLRWLSFDVLVAGRSRPLTCAYSGAPLTTDPSKSVAAPPAGAALLDATVDLRMYCAGAAFDAVLAGAELRARYGSRRRRRGRP